MKKLTLLTKMILSCSAITLLSSCGTFPMESSNDDHVAYNRVSDKGRFTADYASRLPQQVDTSGKKLVLVNPTVHAWGAYGSDGRLVRAGIATAGALTCPPDADTSDCHTGTGTFKITSLGDGDCISTIYPRPDGGGLMPYCMYFNNGQALHGALDNALVEDNVSHGCVRMRIADAEWMRNNFVNVGTRVTVLPY